MAADNALASQVGAEVLEKGGSAVDAAVATALALGVVSPSASGLGGGGFALIYIAKEKRTYALDFREIGPAAITPQHYQKDGAVDSSLSRVGGLAVAVPGEVAGLEFLWKKHGVLPWRDVVSPAAVLARDGFVVSWFLGKVASLVAKRVGPAHALARWLSPRGSVLREGRRVRRSALARTLESIATRGRDGFYKGAVAQDLVDTAQGDGGVLTLKDLENYQPAEREPLIGAFQGMKVATMPLPSSGGLLLLEMLGILDAGRFDLAGMGAGSSGTLHVVAEVLKHAFADRARLLGDDAGSQAIARRLLEPARLANLAKRISAVRTGSHKNYGSYELGRPGGTNDDGGTSHLCVVDSGGNAVSLTTTVNGYFGSLLVGKKSGVVLNNEMDDFSLATGVPNMFGLIQSESNLVGPGKRPLSSMTPTLLLDDEGVVGCFGGSGGPRIISATLQAILNVYVHQDNVRESVGAPRIHHQWLPKTLNVEKGTPADVRAALEKRGHALQSDGYRSAVQAIVRRDGMLQAASDPRKGGAPVAER